LSRPPTVVFVGLAAFLAAEALGVVGGGRSSGQSVPLIVGQAAWILTACAMAAVLIAFRAVRRPLVVAAALIACSTLVAALLLLDFREGVVFDETAAAPLALIAMAAFTCVGLSRYSRRQGPLAPFIVPAVFAALILFLWEAISTGYQTPGILLPAPSAIGRAFSAYSYDLGQDFAQTVVHEAIPGFLLGSAAGVAIAFAIDRSPFLRAGLLPIGNWIGVMPIVGVAPIMVMWFGFGWPSKVAVVVLMTVFPTLVTTLAGLRVSLPLEYDLLASYSATYAQTLFKLRAQAAMPFIISALKLNASLALIGSIVAEFFGTPTYGLGFRISTEVGRLNLDRVWAAIAVAAATGAASYAALSLAERSIAFWHPSQRPRGKS
jgi:NitT/TauT family transport system permease protein